MKKVITVPLCALTCGGMACVLRFLQNKTAFEAATGLPITGHPTAIALIFFLLASAAVLWILSHRVTDQSGDSFSDFFATTEPTWLTLPVMGVLLIAGSGCWDACAILLPDAIASNSTHAPTIQLILAAVALLSAIALFFVTISCRIQEQQASDSPQTSVNSLLLAVPVCLIIRLVLMYRIYSVTPSLGTYYVELLALVFTTLAFYRLSSFAFQAGNSRRFLLYSSLAVLLCIATLADGGSPSRLLLYAGNAVTLLGFMLLHLRTPLKNEEKSSD